MLPKQFLPAITRQRVRRINRPEVVAEVLRHDAMHPEWVHVHEIDYPGAEVVSWNIKDCELVPDEQRPLRIGDKVIALSDYHRTYVGVINNMNVTLERCAIGEFWFDMKEVRHATPSEVHWYFN